MNSTKNPRPNQDALYQALNIYRDAMRPFILRNLKTVQGLAPEDCFQSEADIDIGNFPHLFRKYWRDAFKQHFDLYRDVRGAVSVITEARNRISHPSEKDITSEYALARLYEIADILGQINAPDEKRDVEDIRDKLLLPIPPIPRLEGKQPRFVRFSVIMPDGQRIERNTINATFVTVIEKLGIERVKACNIERFYTPIVATSKHPKHSQAQSGSYYILTAQNTQDKKNDLRKIADALGVELKVEMPPKTQ